jgi:hypothetical protein
MNVSQDVCPLRVPTPSRGSRDPPIHIRATRICPHNEPMRNVGRGLRFGQQHHGDTDGRGHYSGQHTAPPSTTTNKLTLAMQSLAVNQQVLYQHITPISQQMAAMTYHTNQLLLQPHVFPAPHTTPFHVPPIQFQCRMIRTRWTKCRGTRLWTWTPQTFTVCRAHGARRGKPGGYRCPLQS